MQAVLWIQWNPSPGNTVDPPPIRAPTGQNKANNLLLYYHCTQEHKNYVRGCGASNSRVNSQWIQRCVVWGKHPETPHRCSLRESKERKWQDMGWWDSVGVGGWHKWHREDAEEAFTCHSSTRGLLIRRGHRKQREESSVGRPSHLFWRWQRIQQWKAILCVH